MKVKETHNHNLKVKLLILGVSMTSGQLIQNWLWKVIQLYRSLDYFFDSRNWNCSRLPLNSSAPPKFSLGPLYNTEAKSKLGMYLKNALKAKNGLCGIADKIRDLATTDTACKQPLVWSFKPSLQYSVCRLAAAPPPPKTPEPLFCCA